MNNYTKTDDRSKRLLAITRLIESHKIHSQEELLDYLKKEGFTLTQATLSRDLKYLKVDKVADMNGGYYFAMHQQAAGVMLQANEWQNSPFPLDGLLSIDFSLNLAVIKTRPGYANSIASVIDGLDLYEVLGTIAGDDTIIMVLRENVTHKNILSLLKLKITQYKEKK